MLTDPRWLKNFALLFSKRNSSNVLRVATYRFFISLERTVTMKHKLAESPRVVSNHNFENIAGQVLNYNPKK